MNRNYGKLDESNAITYAPNTLYLDGKLILAPRAEHYAAAGYVPVVTDNRPEKVGVYYTANGWAYNAAKTEIDQQWEEHPIVAPTIVRRYSKLKLITAAKAAGKWDALKAWIASAGYSDEWAACMYLSDDYKGFADIKAAIVAAGVATADEIDAILAAAEDETLQAEAVL